MTEKVTQGLVARIAEVFGALPAATALAVGRRSLKGEAAGQTGADRRARLALRIALLRQDKPACAAEEPPLPVAEMIPEPSPEPVEIAPEPPAPPPPPVPPAKPARVTLSSVRLEDAAMLLAAASAPPEPSFTPSLRVVATPPEAPPVAEVPQEEADAGAGAEAEAAAPKPPRRKAGSRKWSASADDLGNAFAALSALGDDTPAAPVPTEKPAQAKVPDAATPPKTKRRSASISAADGLASAASAFAAFQMFDDGDEAAAPTPAENTAASADLGALGDER